MLTTILTKHRSGSHWRWQD